VGSVTAEQRDAVLEDPDRQRLVAACERLGQERDRVAIELQPLQVDVLELVLLRECASDGPLGREAEVDDDLAETLSTLGLLGQCEVELLLRQHATVGEQPAERYPGERGADRRVEGIGLEGGVEKVDKPRHRPDTSRNRPRSS
jgi:hypothetical protein